MASISYVAAPQANIYFDGILIDECYDIQYSYREAKEPIYGYLSKHFDAILSGTVIITGALTINYKHDQYLSMALGLAADPLGTPANSINALPSTLKNYQVAYNTALANYAQAVKDQATLKKKLTGSNQQLTSQKAGYQTAQSQFNTKVSSATAAVQQAQTTIFQFKNNLTMQEDLILEDAYSALVDGIKTTRGVEPSDSNFFDVLSLAYNSSRNQPPQLESYIALKKALKEAQDNVVSVSANPSIAGLTLTQKDITDTQEALKKIDLEKMRRDISDIQSSIDSMTVTDLDLVGAIPIGDQSVSLNSVRAEDYSDGFVIEFSYNGSPHKRILNCQLLGHAHVITQSGMPVKEQYTFIGQKLE